jgi:hypothetical protein
MRKSIVKQGSLIPRSMSLMYDIGTGTVSGDSSSHCGSAYQRCLDLDKFIYICRRITIKIKFVLRGSPSRYQLNSGNVFDYKDAIHHDSDSFL